jgi:hypothetical protein
LDVEEEKEFFFHCVTLKMKAMQSSETLKTALPTVQCTSQKD